MNIVVGQDVHGKSVVDFDRAPRGRVWWLLFHGQIWLKLNESQAGTTILVTDSYWSYISVGGGGKGILFFVNLGYQIRQQPCFCGSSLGHGRQYPLILPKRL